MVSRDSLRAGSYSSSAQTRVSQAQAERVWSTNHTEGQALKRRTGTSRINMLKFLALHRPSNGVWTKWPLPERLSKMGTKYFSRDFLQITGMAIKIVRISK
ncbi:UNVERIFIED_CONTAM: hypothetical protein Sradi_3212300 [Sesamum radiatum]|uniref:Uncharacterized protein n=1 Tax=Sesamum radiatum TaxID=300843 RepID=A0AAW2RHY1_SESRA